MSGAREGSAAAAAADPTGMAEREPSSLDELLAPISGDDPVGESLRYDVIHDEIRELRREDDPTLPQGVWRHELKKADWRGLARLASEVLRERSKDLQMAAWLAEAWTRLDGLAGLARGVELLSALIERYGAELHPRFDDDDAPDGAEAPDDPSLRIAALGRLEGSLPEALLRLPLTRPRSEDGEVLTWGDWKRALYLENLGAARPEVAKEAGGVTRERFLASVGLTPDGLYPALALRADGCRAALEALATLADARYGRDAPAFGSVREELSGIARLARRLAAERGEDDPIEGEDEMSATDPQAESTTTTAAGPGGQAAEAPPAAAAQETASAAITTRAEAYRALDQAAELLLRVEPHSPVPYLVKRAVRWGSLSLSELYGELFQIADPSVVFRLLGIQRREGEE